MTFSLVYCQKACAAVGCHATCSMVMHTPNMTKPESLQCTGAFTTLFHNNSLQGTASDNSPDSVVTSTTTLKCIRFREKLADTHTHTHTHTHTYRSHIIFCGCMVCLTWVRLPSYKQTIHAHIARPL